MKEEQDTIESRIEKAKKSLLFMLEIGEDQAVITVTPDKRGSHISVMRKSDGAVGRCYVDAPRKRADLLL